MTLNNKEWHVKTYIHQIYIYIFRNLTLVERWIPWFWRRLDILANFPSAIWMQKLILMSPVLTSFDEMHEPRYLNWTVFSMGHYEYRWCYQDNLCQDLGSSSRFWFRWFEDQNQWIIGLEVLMLVVEMNDRLGRVSGCLRSHTMGAKIRLIV